MSDKRTFTVVGVETSSGSKRGKGNEGGRFVSSSASGAARKAATKICRSTKVKGRCSLVISLRETSKDSKHKEYVYHVKRILDPKTVIRNGVEVEYKYRTEVHAHKKSAKKSRSKKSAKKSAKKSKSRSKKSKSKSRSKKSKSKSRSKSH